MTTVDREQLIALLADRTDMDRDRVDQQLTELANHIQQAEAKQEGFTIEGLGTFKAVQDRLEFIPSDILSTEINNKYAGMKPIELIGAFKEPAGKDIPVADLPDEQQEPRELKEALEEQEIEAHDSDVAEEQVSEPATPLADISDEKPVAEPEEAAPEGEQEEEIQETEEPAVPTARKEKAKETTSAAGESLSEDPLGKAIVIILVILTLAIAGWLAYDLGLFGSDEAENSPSSSELPAEQQNLDQQSTASVAEVLVDNAENVENTVNESDQEGNEMPSTSVETAAYGLYGEPNENLGSGFYTIIVHSLQTMDLAEEKQQELVDEGFRTKIDGTNVGGRAYYRVGIGQFSTIQAAQEAVRELPEPYKSNNFINRF